METITIALDEYNKLHEQAVKPADTKPAENWLIGQLDSISNLLKNVNDVKEIGYALGRLDMLLIVMKEDEFLIYTGNTQITA